MQSPRRILEWLADSADYCRVFGYAQGFRAYVRSGRRLRGCGRDQRVALTLPGVREPFEVRAGTSDLMVLKQIFLERQYQRRSDAKPPGLIVDCGANIGLSSIYFANQFPDAAIYAIEPAEANFNLLAANIRPYPRITPIQAAVWSSDCRLAIANPEDDHFSYRTVPISAAAAGARPVLAVTIDQVLAQSGFQRIGLLKIDIEGAEKALFNENCHSWLSRTDMLMVELHDRLISGCSRSLYSALLRYSFSQRVAGETIIVEMHPSENEAGAAPGELMSRVAE
jgi:FkbM family methyltransferase